MIPCSDAFGVDLIISEYKKIIESRQKMEPTLTKHIGKLPKMDKLIQSKIEDNLKLKKSNQNLNNFQIFTEEVL